MIFQMRTKGNGHSERRTRCVENCFLSHSALVLLIRWRPYLRALCVVMLPPGRCEIPLISVTWDNETVWDRITFQEPPASCSNNYSHWWPCLLTTPSPKYLSGTNGFPPSHGKQWNEQRLNQRHVMDLMTKWFPPSALWQRWSNMFRIMSVSRVAGKGGDREGGAVNNKHHLLFWREFGHCTFDGKRSWPSGWPANLQQTYWIGRRGEAGRAGSPHQSSAMVWCL